MLQQGEPTGHAATDGRRAAAEGDGRGVRIFGGFVRGFAVGALAGGVAALTVAALVGLAAAGDQGQTGSLVASTVAAYAIFGLVIGTATGGLFGAVAGTVLAALRIERLAPGIAAIIAGGLPVPVVLDLAERIGRPGPNRNEAVVDLLGGLAAVIIFAAIGYLAGAAFRRRQLSSVAPPHRRR